METLLSSSERAPFGWLAFGFSILFLVLAIKEIRETKRTRELKEMLEKKQQEKNPENKSVVNS